MNILEFFLELLRIVIWPAALLGITGQVIQSLEKASQMLLLGKNIREDIARKIVDSISESMK